MVGKGKWLVLTYSVVNELPRMRLIPPGAKEERYRRPILLGNYSYSSINAKYLPIATLVTMKYGQTLDRLIREVLLEYLDLGPVYLLKADVRYGFYHIYLRTEDAPNMVLVYP